MFLDKLKAYGLMVLAIALAVLLGLQTWRLHTAQITLADNLVSIANVRTKAATDLATAQSEHRETEQALNISAAQTRKTTDDQVLVLNSQRTSLLDRVRLAEARAATTKLPQIGTSPRDGSVTGRGDGAEFLGSFGTADVEEGTRAETIRLHLKACYTDYSRLAEALKK